MVVSPDGSLRDALEAIDSGYAGICLACHDDLSFVGVLTDGDVRRALLNGADLATPVASYLVRSPFVASPSEARDSVLDAMHTRRIDAVPIVDDGRLVGMHALQDMIGRGRVPNIAVIMAGGRGRRLGSLTDATPKPMLEVAGKPILARIIDKLVGEGITELAISVNYLAEVITDFFGDGTQFGCTITYLHEHPDQPLGTGGSLGLLRAAGLDPTEPLLVMNGDVIANAPFRSLLDHHTNSNNSATLCTTIYRHAVPFGVINRADDRIDFITEKPEHRWEVNAGIYALSPHLLDLVPPDVEFPITELVARAAQADERVGAFPLPGSWLDIGQPAELNRARGQE